ncbi:glycosyltransferase N-terminal domain-containing protein [Tabrizicola sp.]|uniref:3-deoxy-D-manno-octulosonic acid transferase n=1 Tax=Tabrizicola sp. TaxID=2005166 RepID=UPI00286A584B|nr:glycosyltransferase N-terminal domain-containing protein [Tabrizicola sp.]
MILRRRLARGKEDPARWREKLGEATVARPDGRLIWLHAVGIGEVMALRGLIAAMAQAEPELSFLVTSTARSSAEVFAGNLPARTLHQFLPVDAPQYLDRFLDHWRPDLSIWAEQDLWPGAVVAAARRTIPLALVNARMNDAAFARRRRWRGLFADLYQRFSLIAAQDAGTAAHLTALGATGVQVTGSLKSAAPVLAADAVGLAALRAAVVGRRVWVAASTHAEDEAVALAAQAVLWRADPRWLLILVPRVPSRRAEVAVPTGLPMTVRSLGEGPTGAVYLADTVGELGLWYRLAEVALIGGTFGPVEGHNPWEPAALGVAVLHGPRVANFADDYATLDAGGAARQVTPEGLVAAVTGDLAGMGAIGQALAEAGQRGVRPLADALLALVRR